MSRPHPFARRLSSCFRSGDVTYADEPDYNVRNSSRISQCDAIQQRWNKVKERERRQSETEAQGAIDKRKLGQAQTSNPVKRWSSIRSKPKDCPDDRRRRSLSNAPQATTKKRGQKCASEPQGGSFKSTSSRVQPVDDWENAGRKLSRRIQARESLRAEYESQAGDSLTQQQAQIEFEPQDPKPRRSRSRLPVSRRNSFVSSEAPLSFNQRINTLRSDHTRADEEHEPNKCMSTAGHGAMENWVGGLPSSSTGYRRVSEDEIAPNYGEYVEPLPNLETSMLPVQLHEQSWQRGGRTVRQQSAVMTDVSRTPSTYPGQTPSVLPPKQRQPLHSTSVRSQSLAPEPGAGARQFLSTHRLNKFEFDDKKPALSQARDARHFAETVAAVPEIADQWGQRFYPTTMSALSSNVFEDETEVNLVGRRTRVGEREETPVDRDLLAELERTTYSRLNYNDFFGSDLTEPRGR